MTRYFYTDPLAAAWMAKHHGMKFANGDSLRSACEAAEYEQVKMPFEIHPDSLHLLEPKVGDVVQMGDGDDAIVDCIRQDYLTHNQWLIDEGAKVIRRNGVAFMWPESEVM